MLKYSFLIILNLMSFLLHAQINTTIYENRVFKESLKTIQFAPLKQEGALPLIQLHSNEQLSFSFDDLEGGLKNYRYSIEHCTSDWKSSGLNNILYADGFQDELLNTYKYSSKTFQKYTHYSLIFPNASLKPKISGNYILKIYVDDAKKTLAITRRFYVVDPKASINAQVLQSSQLALRQTNQKLNFEITLAQTINNPQQDLKLYLFQNNIPYSQQTQLKPSLIKGNKIIYNQINQAEFAGSNEFRKFDIRSLRSPGAQVKKIENQQQGFNVELFSDQVNTSPKYSNAFDENGNYFIRNNDSGISNNDANFDLINQTESDYAQVKFSLDIPNLNSTKVYLVGGFNNFQLRPENKLDYDISKGQYHISLPFKQGIYDYKYIYFTDKNQILADQLDGSFFETSNNYQIFLYHKRPGARYEELWAVKQINSNTQIN